MSNETWKCSCGTENSGNFCSLCGKSRTNGNVNADDSFGKTNEYSEQYLRLQIRQQELMNEQEEKRIAMQEEKERKKREYDAKMREYNEKIAQVSTTVLKNWAGSWLVLTLSICASVAAFCSLISLFTNFSSGVGSIISAFVKVLLNVLVCVGFWRSYMMARKKDQPLNGSGVRMLKGVVKFYQVMAYIVGILIIVVFVFIFVTLKSLADDITTGAGNLGADLSTLNESFTGILIGILIALVVVFGVVIFFFTQAVGFSREVAGAFEHKVIPASSSSALAVMFFIVGGFTLIGAIGTVAATNFLGSLLGELGDIGNTLLSFGLFSNVDIADMLSQFANAGMFIFGGILAMKFNGLCNESFRQKQAIEKPEME